MPSLRLQWHLMLFFLAATPLPYCNATVIMSTNNISSVATWIKATEAEDTTDTETTLVGCYPGVFLYNSRIKYVCMVEDASMASGWEVYTTHFLDTAPKGGWPAIVDVEKNTVSFVAWSGTYSGIMAFSIRRRRNDQNLAFVAKRNMEFIQPEATSASFTAPNPYYGMRLTISTNLPTDHNAAGYLLVSSRADCGKITSCNNVGGCHNVTHNSQLPPPGTYYLCVTANNWNNCYLPWGQIGFTVKTLVSSPLYLFKDNVPSIDIYDAETGNTVNSIASRKYLVKCYSGICPSMTSQRGDPMVDVNVCKGSTPADRVYLSNTQSIDSLGTYAMCVEDADGHVSPTALAMTVVQEPFAMKIISASNDFLKVQVSGGDIKTREERYAVCVAEEGKLCTSVTFAKNYCTWSGIKHSDSVHLDLGRMTVGNVTLCLVARSGVYGAKLFVSVQAEKTYVVKLKKMGISFRSVVAAVCVLPFCGIIVIIIVWHLRRQWELSKESSLGETENGNDIRSDSKQNHPGSTSDGEQVSRRNSPYACSSLFSIFEEPGDTLDENDDLVH